MKKLFFTFCIITCPFIYMSCDIKEELRDLLSDDSNCGLVSLPTYYANLRTEGCPNSNSNKILLPLAEYLRLKEVLCNSSDDCVAVTVNPYEGEPINGYLRKINHREEDYPDSCDYFTKQTSSDCGGTYEFE